MKKFIIRLLWFFCVVLLVNQGLYWYLQGVYFNEYEEYDASFDTYLLADSHAWRIFDHSEPYGIHNFSMPSDSYTDMYRKLSFLIEHGTPRRILITADDHALSPVMEVRNNLDRSLQYTHPKAYGGWGAYFFDRYVKNYFVVFNPKLRALLKTNFETWKETTLRLAIGRKSQHAERWDKEDNQPGKSRDRFANHFPSDTTSASMTQSLNDVLALAEEHTIEVVAIKYPLAASYLQVMGTRSYGAEQVFREHGIPVLDYKEEFAAYDSLFYNQDHLTLEGSVELLKLLDADLDSLEAAGVLAPL